MICTFYSYKGGVGRSMALANVASLLARKGLRVLMVDFDLEAPGLEQYFPINPQKIRRSPGLLDLLLSYKQSMSLAAAEEGAEAPFQRLEETFLQRVYEIRGSGKLDLLHAGRRGDEEQLARYAYDLRGFDWQDFYFNWAGDAFFEWLRQELLKLYDVVLVDSRTGVTEMGGICAYQLANAIVLFCAANVQNVEGTASVVGNFFSPAVQARRRNRPLSVLVVPARIEQRDGQLLAGFRERFEARFGQYVPPALGAAGLGFWDLLIPYEASYAFEERVVEQRPTGDGPSPITAAFERLAQAIARLAAPETALAALAEPGAVRPAPAEPLYDRTRKFGGYDAFLSYHQEDREAVAGIARHLKAAGLVPFLDQWEIVPGAAWQERMEEALFQSRACLLFLGRAGLGPWEQDELRATLERRLQEPDFRVVPVLLPGAPPEAIRQLPPSLASLAGVDFQKGLDDEYAFGRLLAGIRGTAAGPGKAVVVHDNPYPGLQAFREQDAAFFFGRQEPIEALLGKLRDGARLLAVTGPSGSGKSSLVQAGLFPKLRRGALPGSELWPLVFLRPGAEPLAALAEALERLHRDLGAGQGLPSRWQPAEGGAGLAARIREVLGPQGDGPERRLFLFLDQLEELFTLCPEPQPFLDSLLAALAEPRSPLRVVVAVREDSLPAFDAHPELAVLLERGRVRVLPLTREEMRLAIEQPAQQVGVAFEVGLVERILDDVGGVPGAQLLLQGLLFQLWHASRRRQGGWLTAAAYEEIGGVRGVVAHGAELLYRRLEATDQEIARRILLRLIHTGEATGETGRRATLTELRALHGDTAGVERVLDVLAEAGLVTVGAAGVELAHEVLIRSWPRVQEWIEEDRQFLRWRERLRAAVGEWQRSGREDDLLLRGAPLVTAESFLSERSGDLTAEEKDFLAAGVALRGRERKQRKKRMRAVAAAAALVLAGAVAATMTVRQSREQSQVALSRQLVAQAASLRGTDPVLALLLSVEALRASDTPEARKGLRTALDYGAIPRAVLSRHRGTVESMAFHPGGRLLASGSDDGAILLWDFKTRQPRRLPAWRDEEDPQAGNEVDGLAFSPDGKLLASGIGSAILLWDVTARKRVGRPIFGHRKQVESLAFSPNGRLLASSGDDARVFLWDVENHRLIHNLRGHTGEVDSVAFSPDGETLASGSEDRTILLWSVDTGEPLGPPLRGHEEGIDSVAFSPDGRMLASGSDDGSLRLWSMETRELLHDFPHGGGGLNSVTFSPDGRLLASGSDDRSIRLWSVATRGPFGPPLTRHSAPVEVVVFAPDGATLASGGADKTVLLWEVAPARKGSGKISSLGDRTDWPARACQVARRKKLKEDEWRRYLPDEPYRETCPDLPPSAPDWRL